MEDGERQTVILSAIKLIKEYECLYLVPLNNMIGYKTPIIKEIHQQKITERIAEKLLYEYLNEKCFSSIYEYKENYSLNKNQLSALLSFFYNNNSVNIDNFFKKLELENGALNNGLITKADIPKKMKQYCYESGKVLRALVERRNKEIELFNSMVIPDYNIQNEIMEITDNDSYLTTDLNLTPTIETILMIEKNSLPDLYYVKNGDCLEVHIMDFFHKYTTHKLQTKTKHEKIKLDDYCLLLGEKKNGNYSDLYLIKSRNTKSNKIEIDIIDGSSEYKNNETLITSLPANYEKNLTIDFAFDKNLDLYCFYKYKYGKEKNKITILDKESNYTSILSETSLILDESYKCCVGKYKGNTTVFGIKSYKENSSIEMCVLNPNKEFNEIIFKTYFDLKTNNDELVFQIGESDGKNCLYALTKSYSHSVIIYVIYI